MNSVSVTIKSDNLLTISEGYDGDWHVGNIMNHLHEVVTMDKASRFTSNHTSICSLAADFNNMQIAPSAICMLSKQPVESIEVMFNLIGEGAEVCVRDAQENFMNVELQMVQRK